MFTSEALEQLQQAKAIEAASAVLQSASIASAAVALPNHFTLHDIEKFLPDRRRMRGSMATASMAHFVEFATDHTDAEQAACFIDAETMKAQAVLNLGSTDVPGHCDFTASLTLEKSAEFASLLGIHGSNKNQQQVAEWMEDWEANITAMNSAGEAIDLKAAIAAVRKISIEANRKVGTEVKSLSSERSMLETINADTDANRPHFLDFKCTPYKEMDEMVFPIRLSIITGEKDPVLRLHIRRFDLLKEQIAETFADKLTAAMESSEPPGAGTMPVYIGKFDSK